MLLPACGSKHKDEKELSSQAELYDTGMELISTMDEMLKSEEYKALFVSGNGLDSVIDTVNTDDYGSPVAVYRISMPEEKKLLKTMGYSDSWNKLSDNLKEQVKNRLSFSSIATIINGTFGGSEKLAFSSAFIASDKLDTLTLEEPTTFLYIFEKGTPIAITFNEYGAVTGQFIFIEDTDTLSKVKSIFRHYNCTVSEVDFN